MHTWNNDRTFESSKLLHFKICYQLEQEIKASNNSVTKDLVVICVVIWTRINYINAVVYEVDAVDGIVLLHNRQKELEMKEVKWSAETVSSKSVGSLFL